MIPISNYRFTLRFCEQGTKLPNSHFPAAGRLYRIEADPQHREHFDEDALAKLAQSLKDHGQKQPIRVRWDESRDKYIVVSGERRFRAAILAGLTDIQCVLSGGDQTPAEIPRDQVIENALREDL